MIFRSKLNAVAKTSVIAARSAQAAPRVAGSKPYSPVSAGLLSYIAIVVVATGSAFIIADFSQSSASRKVTDIDQPVSVAPHSA